jgi:hypothetical protein
VTARLAAATGLRRRGPGRVTIAGMARRLRASAPPAARASSAVVTVAGDVVALALELADGDRRRLRVLGPDSVLVLNTAG